MASFNSNASLNDVLKLLSMSNSFDYVIGKDSVTITGTNFGEVVCLRGVSFGPGHPAQFQQTDDSITTTVPSGGKKGLVLLTVTTASGENSKPFLIK